MQLKTILNRVQKFKSFVYGNIVWLDSGKNSLALLVQVVARANSKPICSGCGNPGPGYDTLAAAECLSLCRSGILPSFSPMPCAGSTAGRAA